MPVVLGAGGVERILEVQLTPHERLAFQKSVNAVQTLVEVMTRLTG